MNFRSQPLVEAREQFGFVMMLEGISMAQAIHRIVGRILTMKQVIIMTISITKTVSENVFYHRDWPLFDRIRAACHSKIIPIITVIELTAARSDASQTLEELATATATETVTLVKNAAGTEYRTWLFVAHGPWQPASRIIRYNKLWKAHSDLLASKGVLTVGEEIEIKSDGFIRFAGLLEVTGDAFIKAINTVRTNSACAIICSRRPNIDSEVSIRSIFLSAFPETHEMQQGSIDWMVLALDRCSQGDILIRVSGLFDDRDVSIDVIAPADTLAAL